MVKILLVGYLVWHIASTCGMLYIIIPCTYQCIASGNYPYTGKGWVFDQYEIMTNTSPPEANIVIKYCI